ncbi:hypothetical protein SDC9_202663 [bioreactor metagenome]|uniref:Uncharacterized protein n=1 Tax=bioreactor metagenome TaxID=1076179 RepID=A0A645J3B9_9ZZZZ
MQYGVPTGLGNRGQYDVVDLLLNEVANGGDLIFLFLLCVVKNQFVAIGLGKGALHALGVCCAPIAFGANLRETDNDQVVAAGGCGGSCRCCAACRRGAACCAATGCQAKYQCRSEQK